MADKLIDMLRRKRADYGEECEWHRFLLDAYAGTGGFCGKVRTPRVGFLGSAATAYDASSLTNSTSSEQPDTYLDRFPREDDDKWKRRCDVAHYDNYLGPIADLFISYLNSAKNSYEGVPSNVEEWQTDVTGTGVSWEELLDGIIHPRASVLGWCPVLFDRDAKPANAVVRTVADEQALNLRLRAVPLFPSNVLEWEIDQTNGQMLWVKIFTPHSVRTNPLGEADVYEEYRIFTRDTFSVYRVREGKEGPKVEIVAENEPHTAGAVPLVIFKAKPTPDDAVRGISLVSEIAAAQRRHFNLLSELDEHIRNNVFAILAVPMKDTTQELGSVQSGTGIAIKIPMDATQSLHYAAPPASVSETLEARIEAVVREMHRMARAPFENDKGGAQSGTALSQKFDATNRKIGDASSSLATGEQQSLRLVTNMHGKGGAASEASLKIKVAPQREFRVDDIGTDIDNALKILGMPGMPRTARVVTIRRVLDKFLHNLSEKERKALEDELKKLQEEPEPAPAVTPKKPGEEPPPGGNKPPSDDDETEDDQQRQAA